MKRHQFATCVALVLLASACGTEPVDIATPNDPEVSESARMDVIGRQHFAAAGTERARIQTIAGTLHSAAMLDLKRNRGNYVRHGESGLRAHCMGGFRLGVRYAREADRILMTNRTETERRMLVTEGLGKSFPVCAQYLPREMSVLSTTGSSLPIAAQSPDSVYGEFVPYIESLEVAVASWTKPTLAEVNQLANATLSAASGIHSADYDVLVSAVDFVVSSYLEYEDEPWAYEECPATVDPHPAFCEPVPMLVFPTQEGSRWRFVGLAMIDGAAGLRTYKEIGWLAKITPQTRALAVGGGIAVGVAASGVALMATE